MTYQEQSDLLEAETGMSKKLLGWPPPNRELAALPDAIDLRKRLDVALDETWNDEELRDLLKAAMAVTKTAWGHCSHCKHKVQVEILDAKAVVSAFAELKNQASGRPSQAEVESDRSIVFENKVVLPDEEGES